MLLDAFVDEVTPDGRFEGWACRPGHVERLHVGIFHNGVLAAEAVTGDYRADLLAAGHGLGHCAFSARLRAYPAPGHHAFDVALVGHGTGMQRFFVTVPPMGRQAPAAPAGPKPGWTDAEVLENLSRFQLADQLAALGPERFADGVFQFVLQRWPEPEMTEAVQRAHAAGVFDPEAFVREVLLSDERRGAAGRELPSPFDYRFPFRYPVG